MWEAGNKGHVESGEIGAKRGQLSTPKSKVAGLGSLRKRCLTGGLKEMDGVGGWKVIGTYGLGGDR